MERLKSTKSTRERDEGALAELAFQHCLDPDLSLPAQIKHEEEEVAQLEELVKDSVLPLRIKQLAAFTYFAKSLEKEEFLLQLATITSNLEDELRPNFQELPPSLPLILSRRIPSIPLTAEFFDHLRSFAKRLSIPFDGVMQVAHLVHHLTLNESERKAIKESGKREIELESPLPVFGLQRSVTGFYPRTFLSSFCKRPRGNQVLLSPKVVAFSANEGGMHYDYYHIRLAATVTPDMCRDWTFLAAVPVVLSSCSISAYPVTFIGGHWYPVENSRLLELCDNWSPHPSEGETSLKTTTGIKISGQFTQSGMEPGGSIGGEVSLEHESERSVPDIEVITSMRSTRVEWRSIFPNLHAKEDRGNCCSRSSVAVSGQWIWRVPKDQARAGGLYLPYPAVQLDDEPSGPDPKGQKRFFNVAFGVQVGFSEIVTLPLFEKTLFYKEHLMKVIEGILDGTIISIVVPPKLPAGRETTVTITQSQSSDAVKVAGDKEGKKKGKK
jgi:hypothetical protein